MTRFRTAIPAGIVQRKRVANSAPGVPAGFGSGGASRAAASTTASTYWCGVIAGLGTGPFAPGLPSSRSTGMTGRRWENWSGGGGVGSPWERRGGAGVTKVDFRDRIV
jgi:hypothetical protein